jgi:3-methyl-2-oxobutanoate hydroxymethyltransferase
MPIMQKVFEDYKSDVETRAYPGPEHSVFMKPDELEKLRKLVNWEEKRQPVGAR